MNQKKIKAWHWERIPESTVSDTTNAHSVENWRRGRGRGRGFDTTAGRLKRRPTVVWLRCRRRTGLIVVPRRSLRRPVSIPALRWLISDTSSHSSSIDEPRTTSAGERLATVHRFRCRTSLPRHTAARASHSCMLGKHSLFLLWVIFLFVYSYYWYLFPIHLPKYYFILCWY